MYGQLVPAAFNGPGLSLFNRILIPLILVASALGVLETEPTLTSRFAEIFEGLEVFFGAIFSLELLARLWVAPERDRTRPTWLTRLEFVLSPATLADLIAVACSFMPAIGPSALFLRWVRLGRILRLAKLGRTSRALEYMISAVVDRRDELLLSLGAGLMLMIAAATALYFAEGVVQPDEFGSIPRALWWSVSALTTIGYGDAIPVTPLGKLLASTTAILSIGLIAMPTGILAAAFSDGVQRHRAERDSQMGHDA
jgi:voltage-gated potassium channel